jgi:fructokinase
MGATERYGGVETGGSWCVCALGTGPDRLDALEKFPTGGPDETIARTVEFFERHGRPSAVGVAAFGPIELDPAAADWGTLGATPKPGWSGARLGPALRDALQLPVVLETDTTAAALGERRWGAGQGCASLCYLTVGTGIGAGLVLDGAPVHGLMHPEVGHLRVPHDRARDPFAGACPFHGDCWEGLAAGPAIAARWGASGDRLDDDHPAWELEAEYLALGILSIVLIAAPQRVIAGGGVMQRRCLLPRIRTRLPELLAEYPPGPRIAADADYLVAPALGDEAGVLGALALVAAAGGR